jgi:hypothetical protein
VIVPRHVPRRQGLILTQGVMPVRHVTGCILVFASASWQP